MVAALLKLKEPPRADAADALAIAIAHVHAAPARRIASMHAALRVPAARIRGARQGVLP
jgi:Holliday junction resolvasome RuvABC endonuclease subunit